MIKILQDMGFDTSEEPYVNMYGVKIHKNHIRDGSGRFDGYIIERPKRFKVVHTKQDVIDCLTGSRFD